MKWSIPEKVVEQGREYANQGRVVAIEPDPVMQVWHAEVLGSETYHVDLDGTAKEADVCECAYWQEKGYCKHTVAVELALRSKGYSRVLKMNPHLPTVAGNDRFSKVFMQKFAGLQEKEFKKEQNIGKPLRVEFQMENIETIPFHPEKSVLVVNLKIGYRGKGNRVYVVKNIGEFLLAYEKQAMYEVKSDMQLFLQRENFDEAEQQLLDIAVGFYRSMQMSLGSLGPLVNKLGAKNVMLPQNGASEFIQLLIEVGQFRLKIFQFELKNIVYQQQQLLPMNFFVRPFNDGYVLIVDSDVLNYWENYGWILTDKAIQPISAKQAEVYTMLQQLMKRMKKPEVMFYKEDVPDLFSFVLPMLKEIGQVQIDDNLQEEMLQVPLEAQIYLRKSRNLLRARVDFRYKDVVFSTDSRFDKQQQKSQFVIRNHKKERQIARMLDSFQYELGKTTYRKVFPDGADLYNLFNIEIPQMKKLAQVELEENVSELLLDASKYKPQIIVTENDSWLDIHFDITGIEEAEVDDLMIHLMNDEDFYQMSNGTLLPLDSLEFQQTSEALSKIRQAIKYGNGQFKVSRYEGIQVEEALGQMDNAKLTPAFKKMVKDLTQPEDFEVELPKDLHAEMREYQKTGFRWLKMLRYYRFSGILADDMGLGKTLQTIAFILSEKEDNPELAPTLIVAPASLIYNWQMELKRFAPSLTSIVVAGSKAERMALLQEKTDIFITSYAGLRQDGESYQDLTLSTLVIDEAQMVKNSATKTAQAVKNLKVKQRFALSGTPIENNLEELWTLFQLLMPGFLPSKKKFITIPPQEIARLIQPFILRREKSQVLKDLPEKLESNLYSSLTPEQKTIYLAYLKKMQNQVAGMNKKAFQQNQIGILAGLTRLRQICCDPHLCDDTFEGESGKLEQAKELVVKAKANHRRILLFSQFTSMLSILERELNDLGISSFYLRGSTKPKDRMKMVEAFNGGEKDIFLISLKAGGTGLNLTGADTVILYDLWWNPAVEEQATGRAHRMGQKKVVEVWRLIAEGTIEEKIDRLQQEKKELFQQVLTSDAEHQLRRLTEDDIREILNIGLER